MASSTPKSGGYDCKFLDAPPDKLVCQICLLVSATPHQVTCCGRVYCQACHDEHKKRSRTCPNCRKRGQKFPDIRGEWTLDFSNIGTTYCRLMPRPLLKKSKGVWQHGYTMPRPARTVECVPIRLQSSLSHVDCCDQICAQVVVVPFDKSLRFLRERMGSKKLLL